jgi:hypothetical protein
MRVLEARFHSENGKIGRFIVVAHVVWAKDENRPRVEPSPSLLATMAPATMLAKLQFLVERPGAGTFERLKSLQSRFWSFVDVSPSV